MNRSILGSVAMVCAATVFVAAQTPAPSIQKSAAQSSATPTLTLSGCITPGTTPADAFTMSNPFIVGNGTPTPTPGESTTAESTPATGVTTLYRLSGSDLSAHAGKRVQIVGGLVPSANGAATAGASSSGVTGQTGMSGAGSAGPGVPATTTLPEFRVVSVRPIEGPCPPR